MVKDLLDRSPQQTFLVCGDNSLYETLLDEAGLLQYPIVTTKAPQLTIDEARAIASFASGGTIEPTIGVFYFASYSNGAAEVLLKALEEPNPLVMVIIVTPYPYTFPQTLRSRMQLIAAAQKETDSTSLKELAKVGQALSTSTEDAAERREALLSFIDSVEKRSALDHNRSLAERAYDAKRYILNANLPPKQVLEYLLLYMV